MTLLELACLCVEHMYFPVVLFLVGLVSLEVLADVLDHAHGDHKSEGVEHHWLASGDRDQIDHLQEHDDQIENVRHLGELKEQVLGQEVKHCVLGGLDAILIVLPPPAVTVSTIARIGLIRPIDVDCPELPAVGVRHFSTGGILHQPAL